MEMALTDFLVQQVDVFLLIFMRVSGIFVVAPIFGNESVPITARIGAVTMISFVLFPMVSETALVHADHWLLFVYYGMVELFIGISIGFVGAVYFSMIILAGTVMDRQTGFMRANAFDPLSEGEVPILGSFYNILFVLLFLGINGHHMFIRALFDSYETIPIGYTLHLTDDLIRVLIIAFRDIMILAFILCTPIAVTSLITNVLLGIFAKTMPQINVFIVGMPLRIITGLLTIWVTLHAILPFSEHFFDRMFRAIYQMMRTFA